jgi:hypothetical protein
MPLLRTINVLAFLTASIIGTIAAAAALVGFYKWAVIMFMCAALLFMLTFTTVLLIRPITTVASTFAMAMFSVGALGVFISSVEVYKMDTNPTQSFMIGSSFEC